MVKARRIMYLLIISLLVTVGFFSVSGESETKNFIENGGFEDVLQEDGLKDWKVWSGGGNQPGVTTDPENVLAGENAGRLVPGTSFELDLKGLKPHTDYIYSAYAKVSDEKGSPKLGVKGFAGDTPQILQPVKGTEYVEYTIEFTTGTQESATIFFWASGDLQGDSEGYIDEVSVTEKGVEDGKNYVTNPGFEEFATDLRPAKWVAVQNEGTTQSTTTESEHVYKGDRAGEVLPEGALEYKLTGLRKNTNYNFSAYVKVSEEGAVAKLGVKDTDDSKDENVLNVEYDKHEVIFNTGDKTSATVYFSGADLTGEQKAYIDEAMLEEHFEEGEVRVALNIDKLQLAKDDVYPLSPKVVPATADNKAVTYTSEPEGIVSIDEDGNMRGLKAGKTTITATPQANGEADTAEITVTAEKQPWYPNGNADKWTLTKEDNFEGTELDTDLWTIRGKEVFDYHRDDLVEVSDGTLKLWIEREDSGDLVMGRVDTSPDGLWSGDEPKFDQRYGFFEVSAKIPPVEETYFAFWMMNEPGTGVVSGNANVGAEIDITETVYKADVTESVIHYDGYGDHHKSVGSGQQPAPNIHNGFHVFGLEWEEDYLRFYFDGELTWEVTDKDLIPWVKETFILSSGWARSAGWGDGNKDNADLPYYSEIDWFRAYERTEPIVREDNTEPIIARIDPLEVPVNGTVDLREEVFAVDNVDDKFELTEKIIIDDSDLKLDTVGEYTVTYTVTDEAGNTTTADRIVKVVEGDSEDEEDEDGNDDVETPGEDPEGDGNDDGDTPGEDPEGDGNDDGETPGEDAEGDGNDDGETPGEDPEGDGNDDGETPGEDPEGDGNDDGETPGIDTGNDNSGVDSDGTESDPNQVDQDGNKLPTTATNMFNWLIAGAIFLAIGIGTYFFMRRREA